MKLLDRFVSAWWHTSGYAAARSGDYERALLCFDRADQKSPPSLLRTGYRAMVLTLLDRKEDARNTFRQLAEAKQSSDANDEYARFYARMFVANLDNDVIEAERLATEMSRIPCLRSVKDLLFPIRPALLAAESLLTAYGIKDADPLGFREEGSGVRWMKAVEAYAKEDFLQALHHIESAEAVRGALPAQKALKAGLLVHLGRNDEADALFSEAIEEVEGRASVDDRYLRLFCEIHRSSDVDEHHLIAEAEALAPETALRHFLPVEGFNLKFWARPESIYANVSIQLGCSQTEIMRGAVKPG